MTNWTIEGLRGVGKVELSLDDSKRVYAFLGSNGVGKTKTLESLLLLLIARTGEIRIHYPSNDFVEAVHYGNESVHKGKYSAILSETPQNWLPAFKAFAYLGAADRSGLHSPPMTKTSSIGSFEQRKKDYFNKLEHAFNTGSIPSVGMSDSLHHWFILRAQSDNSYQKSKDNRSIEIETVLEALNTIDSRIARKLRIDGAENVFLTIADEINKEGEERELSQLSSGFISLVKIIQSIISAYAAFTNEVNLRHVRGIVLIDEIDSHLHVEWQVKIIPTLKKLFPNTTFYITTHSPLVLSQLEEGEAYLLKRDDDGVVRSHVINSPNKRILSDVLVDAFDIDLNKLKRESMEHSDQTAAKQKLLALLKSNKGGA